jgi:hypothetical protein
MKTNIVTSDYPTLASNAEYADAFDKLTRFSTALRRAEADSTALHESWLASLEIAQREPDADRITKAERMLAGETVFDAPKKIEANKALVTSLTRALTAQQTVVNAMRRALSAKAAAHFRDEHKALVQKIVTALEQLSAAVREEIDLHSLIESLGYDQSLPAMRFAIPDATIDPKDPDGGYAPAWYRDAAEYLLTPEQVEARSVKAAAGSRLARMSKLFGGSEPAASNPVSASPQSGVIVS